MAATLSAMIEAIAEMPDENLGGADPHSKERVQIIGNGMRHEMILDARTLLSANI